MNRSRLLPTILLILTPALVTLALITVFLRADPRSFVPVSADEVYNWRQIATFKTVGFDGGYYAHHELTASIPFTRFGAWGPFFPMLYGTIARVVGWTLSSPPVYNLFVLGTALALLVLVTRPDRRVILLLIAAVGTYWALLLYAPTAMQESLNHAFGIVLAGQFYVLLSRQTSNRFKLITVILICVAGLFRLSWVFLLLPLAFYGSKDRRALRVTSALIGIVLVAWLSRAFAAPYPYVLGNILGILRGSPLEGLLLLWGYVAENTRTLIFGGREPFALELLLNYQYLFGLTYVLFYRLSPRLRRTASPDHMLHLLNLVPVLFFVLIYFVGYFIGYRHMAMHLLFSLIVAVLFKNWRFAAPIIASNALFVVAFLWTFQHVIPGEAAFNYEMDRLRRFEQEIASVIEVNLGADPWCNTVLAHNTWDVRFLALPPEIGYSVVLIWDLQNMPPRSQYIISDPTMESHLAGLHLQQLAHADDLVLYRNLDANCP